MSSNNENENKVDEHPVKISKEAIKCAIEEILNKQHEPKQNESKKRANSDLLSNEASSSKVQKLNEHEAARTTSESSDRTSDESTCGANLRQRKHSEFDRISEILKTVDCDAIKIIESAKRNEIELHMMISNKHYEYLGLEYFIEFQAHKQIDKIVAPKYYCSLCAEPLVGNYKQFVINHLTSEQHVLKYLSIKHPNEFKILTSINDADLRMSKIHSLNYRIMCGLSLRQKQALLVYLPNLDETFNKCCVKLNQECKKIGDYETKAQAVNSIPTAFTDELDAHSEECSESEIEDYVKEKGLPKYSLLRLKHMREMRKAKEEYNNKTNMEIFADSIHFMVHRLQSDDERVKFLNNILKLVSNIVRTRHLNYSLVANVSSQDEAKDLIEKITSDSSSQNVELRSHHIRSIRLYIEENKDSMEQSKLKKLAIRLKEIFSNEKN